MTPQRAKQVRLDLELTQEELSDLIGSSSGNISNWENGVRGMSHGVKSLYLAMEFIVKQGKGKQFKRFMKD